MACQGGRTAVEVGSAIGMVSMYLAARGMRVYAMDPVLPNVQRMGESACANGVRHCLAMRRAQAPGAKALAWGEDVCANSTQWGPFAPEHLTMIHAAAGRATEGSRMISWVTEREKDCRIQETETSGRGGGGGGEGRRE